MEPEIRVCVDSDDLTRTAAEVFARQATAAIAANGRFTVCLAGGNTPRSVYRLIASPPLAEGIDWQRVFLFWGDERCVPGEHPDSNYRMAAEALLDIVPIPRHNVFRIWGELPAERAAAEYETTLHEFFCEEEATRDQGATPCFDLTLLGLGDDAHTASLFPGTDAIQERKRWVVGHRVEKLNAWRVTLTPQALNASTSVAFMVSGKSKAEAVRHVLRGPHDPMRFPAQSIRPANAPPTWLLDREAAALLEP